MPPKFNPQLPSEWEQEVMKGGNFLRAESKRQESKDPLKLIQKDMESREIMDWLENLEEVPDEEVDYYDGLVSRDMEEGRRMYERNLKDGILPPEQRLN